MAGYYIYFILWRADSPKQLMFIIIDQMSYLQQYICTRQLRRASPPRPRRDLFGLHKLKARSRLGEPAWFPCSHINTI
jgi:hypothetical protein